MFLKARIAIKFALSLYNNNNAIMLSYDNKCILVLFTCGPRLASGDLNKNDLKIDFFFDFSQFLFKDVCIPDWLVSTIVCGLKLLQFFSDQQNTHVSDLVERGVCSETEICAGYIVADCCRDSNNGDAEFGEFLPSLGHLHHSLESLLPQKQASYHRNRLSHSHLCLEISLTICCWFGLK